MLVDVCAEVICCITDFIYDDIISVYFDLSIGIKCKLISVLLLNCSTDIFIVILVTANH